MSAGRSPWLAGQGLRFTKKAARNPAFTLIELLVVVAIIAILAALLLPSLWRARAAAVSTACKSNLHQIAVALKVYTDENQAFPAWFDRTYWDARLLPLAAKNRNLFICPAVKPRPLWPDNPLVPCINPCYGFNASGTARFGAFPTLGLDGGRKATQGPYPTQMYLKEVAVRVPTEMVSVAECAPTIFAFTPPHCQDESPPEIISTTNLLWELEAGRHNQGVNVAFCDAHVEYAKVRLWLKRTEPGRRRWNNDHEPHRETWAGSP